MECLVVREVADVLANKCLALDDQRDRVLEIRTERQHRAFDRQRCHCAGGISARTSENYRTECTSSDDRIVHRRAMGRSPIRNASAVSESCFNASASLYAIGSLDRLALVITNASGAPAAKSRCCN